MVRLRRQSKKLTRDDVLHMSSLADLHLTDSEVTKFEKQLQDTLGFIENLQELDTDQVKETSQTVKLTNVWFEDGADNQRLLTHEEAIANAKNIRKSCFVVKRILGR